MTDDDNDTCSPTAQMALNARIVANAGLDTDSDGSLRHTAIRMTMATRMPRWCPTADAARSVRSARTCDGDTCDDCSVAGTPPDTANDGTGHGLATVPAMPAIRTTTGTATPMRTRRRTASPTSDPLNALVDSLSTRTADLGSVTRWIRTTMATPLLRRRGRRSTEPVRLPGQRCGYLLTTALGGGHARRHGQRRPGHRLRHGL